MNTPPMILVGHSARNAVADVSTANMQTAPEEKLATEGCEYPSAARFETGAVYSGRSVCDHNCIWRYKVMRRTDKTVWITAVRQDGRLDPSDARRCKVHTSPYDGEEYCLPHGRYSMCLHLSAGNKET